MDQFALDERLDGGGPKEGDHLGKKCSAATSTKLRISPGEEVPAWIDIPDLCSDCEHWTSQSMAVDPEKNEVENKGGVVSNRRRA